MTTSDNLNFVTLIPKEQVRNFPTSFQIPGNTILYFSSDDEFSRYIKGKHNELSEKIENSGFSFTIIDTVSTNSEEDKHTYAKIHKILGYQLPSVKTTLFTFDDWYFKNTNELNNKLEHLYINDFHKKNSEDSQKEVESMLKHPLSREEVLEQEKRRMKGMTDRRRKWKALQK
ncbi:MAG: hypothetical protein GX102_05845 [Porphyromonadaceae bacterium]|jgi:hypothetical protein|nr:hypothetical protein [Porphyromonadaceae bacterium]